MAPPVSTYDYYSHIQIGFADSLLFLQTWVTRNICIHKQTSWYLALESIAQLLIMIHLLF